MIYTTNVQAQADLSFTHHVKARISFFFQRKKGYSGVGTREEAWGMRSCVGGHLPQCTKCMIQYYVKL